MQTTRRRFIQSGLCAFAMTETLSQTATRAAAAAAAKQIPIGFQLYTVRGEFARDVPGTLKKIAELGYQGVEFWGYGGTPDVYQGHSAAELRMLLDEHGLQCCGMHLELKALAAENLDRTVENNRVLGNTFLNVAAAQEKMKAEPGILELAAFLNDTAARVRPHKMTVGYHAHPFDFARVNDRYAWEILFQHTQPAINMQMDVGNCLGGNGDPLTMLKEFPGRTPTIHIKEHKDKTFDSDFYKEVFRLCETTSGTQWYIVEMGGPEGNGFDVPRAALEKLHHAGK